MSQTADYNTRIVKNMFFLYVRMFFMMEVFMVL